MSHSIWNEDPVGYLVFKRVWSVVATIIFPFAHYCVIRKSPKNFGALKWILYFHVCWITIEWLSNSMLIDTFDFQPSVIIRIDGFLRVFVDSVVLFKICCCIENISLTSALILFCSRLLFIVHVARRKETMCQKVLKVLTYMFVIFTGMWSLPYTIGSVPVDQNQIKRYIVETEINYPDCIWNPSSVAVDDPRDGSDDVMPYIEVASWISISLVIFVSAKVVFCLLDRKMKHMSSATKKMHRTFNQRTVFQAIIYMCMHSIPFTLLYSSMLLKFHVPGLTYFIDFFSENHPTACAVTLFLFYDPYQNYLLQVFRIPKTPRITEASTNTTRSRSRSLVKI